MSDDLNPMGGDAAKAEAVATARQLERVGDAAKQLIQAANDAAAARSEAMDTRGRNAIGYPERVFAVHQNRRRMDQVAQDALESYIEAVRKLTNQE